MDNTIEYLNTDLDLKSPTDLEPLASALRSGGVFDLHVSRWDDGLWYARFETDECYSEPEPNITAMLDVLERLPEAQRATWDQCILREFNIGYDCGDKPWAFNQGLAPELLGRLAAIGASLRITLYPDREFNTGK
ncbi:MAG: hypothetical protein SGJ19_07010 [Planctomycetia bacterium]|nr:hypothetical protein [Planctomycetia bacterium]